MVTEIDIEAIELTEAANRAFCDAVAIDCATGDFMIASDQFDQLIDFPFKLRARTIHEKAK